MNTLLHINYQLSPIFASAMNSQRTMYATVRVSARHLQKGSPHDELPCRCMTPLLRVIARTTTTVQRQFLQHGHDVATNNSNLDRKMNPSANYKRISVDGNDNTVRLSKRMSELGICSRREAARILCAVSKCNDLSTLKHLKEVIYLRGRPVMDGTAVKVSTDEIHIEVRSGDDPPRKNEEEQSEVFKEFVPYPDRPWEEIMGDTIILNKPIGYVSGQEEHQHVPAVRLLNRENMHLHGLDKATQDMFRKGDALHFDHWKFNGFDIMANSVPKHIRMTLDEETVGKKNVSETQTLSGYAPAGRLDIDSTGVLLFTRSGVMARRLIEPECKIPKEYFVTVEPAVQLNAKERELRISSLPRPAKDLNVLLKDGNRLAGALNPLKPLLVAEWLDKDQSTGDSQRQIRMMRLVLLEGKKRQIRRMCRELLGWHVVKLFRSSVGPVKIGSLPEGKWRPLTREEVKAIFKKQPVPHKKNPSINDSLTQDVKVNILPETKVMREVVEALKREPTGWLPITTLQRQVGKRLNFLPKKEGIRKQWKEQLRQVCRDNPTRLVFRGTQYIGLRGKVGTDEKGNVYQSMSSKGST